VKYPSVHQALPRHWPTPARSILVLTACCLLLATRANADFYKYLDADGVETFTNTPTKSGAVRVLREAKLKPVTRTVAKRVNSEINTEVPRFTNQQSQLPVQGIVTSSVGWRHDPIDGTIRHHNGADISVPSGTKVEAIAAGRVIESAMHGGYGNLVEIDHGGGMRSRYGHNSQLEVKVGDQVTAGQTIAFSGSTGRSTGPHLHFELWQNGSNVTESYLRTGAGVPEVAGGIRSYLHSDGSLVFTNKR
jgi:murein DD-endopeptidase MepM/ murein hydrolase activator NlpD